jgi:TonB family protein
VLIVGFEGCGRLAKRRRVAGAALSLACSTTLGQPVADRPRVTLASVVRGSCELGEQAPSARSGTLVLNYKVQPSGTLTSITVVQPSPTPAFDAEQVERLKTCTFAPGTNTDESNESTGLLVLFTGRAPNPPPEGPTVLLKAGLQNAQECAPRARDYPRLSVQRNEQGNNRIHFAVAADGRLLAVQLVGSTGYPALDTAAMNGFLGCRFRPARTAHGAATSSWFDLEYRWRLD